MNMGNYNAITGALRESMDKNVTAPALAWEALAQQEMARRRQLQDLAAQREFIDRQRQLQREHEMRLETLRTESSQPTSGEILGEIERQKIEREAYAKARKDLEFESLAARREQALALVPTAVSQFANYLTSPGLELPDGAKAFNSNAVSLVQTDFEAAEKKYPVEAPVIKAHLDAAKALIEVSSNLRGFDDKNRSDQWLVKFCFEQEQALKRLPEEQKKIDGKTFLTWAEYAEATRTNSGAASAYWTLSEIQLLERLATDAHTSTRQKLADLEAAGFVRKAKQDQTP